MDIPTASFEQLKTAREEINARLIELEASAIAEIKEKAAMFGLSLTREPPKKERRKRRTKQEMLEASAI